MPSFVLINQGGLAQFLPLFVAVHQSEQKPGFRTREETSSRKHIQALTPNCPPQTFPAIKDQFMVSNKWYHM